MMDSVKDYLPPKRFSTLAYVCVILHLMCGAILIAITMDSNSDDMEKFSCAVNTTFATHKTYVEKTCFSNYNDVYNSHIRLFAFVMLSFGSVAVVSVIYSLAVANRIDKTERYLTKRDETQTDAKKEIIEPGRKTYYVFYCYFIHLVARFILGVLFTILQYYVFYTNGFDSEFTCDYSALTQPDPTITTATMNTSVLLSNVTCTNLAAKDKEFWATSVTVCNVIATVIALTEVIYLTLHQCSCFNPQSNPPWSCDSKFITEHFLGETYIPFENDEFTGVDNCTPTSDQIYREKILNASLKPDINYGFNTNISLDDMCIDVIIQTEQAPLKFSKHMTRHEINDVYMKVPEHSLRLEEVKDLFYPNKNTKGNCPQTILALGRPGIGKTVLTKKIMRDWAKGIDRFYHGKIAFFFKFRWFHFEQLQNVTLKKFLQIGTELKESEFESIFAEIVVNPQNAIFVFDGLDEFGGNLQKFHNFLDQSKMSPDDPTCPMSAMFLFIKILSGQIFPEATVLVTSRPTANHVLSKLHFDRKVEIIGFTEEKIEKYVEQFCVNHEKPDLKPKIWSHIKSSELKNLCYIPVNCFIVCVTLINCLSDQGNDNVLPTTLTKLYQAALAYFCLYHNRNKTNKNYEKVIKKLQQLAFRGMENDQLIFDDEVVNEQMKESGLLHCLPVPIFQIQTQVCFIHLTVQEFLAAKYIVETKEPEEIKKFISSHVEHGKWHLVLQFLAGLLGKKMEMSEEYRTCVLAFGQHLHPRTEYYSEDIVCSKLNNVMLMKCVRETENEDIAKEIAGTSALKQVTKIDTNVISFNTPIDLAAIVFVYKHLNLLKYVLLRQIENLDCVLEITKLLRHRCIETLYFSSCGISPVQEALKHLLGAMTTSECRINHEHCELAHLFLSGSGITDDDVSILTEFLKNARGVCLKRLILSGNEITSVGISRFSDVLGHEACNQLEVLRLDRNHNIGDDGLRTLCRALGEKQHKLRELHLKQCSVSSAGASWLGQVLGNKNCKITHLDIGVNGLRDEGVRMLCSDFGRGNCELDVLNLFSCKLTPACMPDLSGILENEKCRLTDLDLSDNDIDDEGAGMLFYALRAKQSSLTHLNLSNCSLTKECMISLCGALDDEHCRLTFLNVSNNYIGDEGVKMLCCVLDKEQCKLIMLNIAGCSLSDKCIPFLCEALRNVRCKLTELHLCSFPLASGRFPNKFTSECKRLLTDATESEHCRARGFSKNFWFQEWKIAAASAMT